MKIYNITIICFGIALLLVGCGEQPMANAANCTPEMKEKILSDLMFEASRNTFIDDCRSFDKAKQLRSGTFKKSAPGDY